MANLNMVVSVFFALVGMFVGLVLFRFGQNSPASEITARANKEGLRITDAAKTEAAVVVEKARVAAEALKEEGRAAEERAMAAKQRVDDAARTVSDAQREAETIRKDAALDAKARTLEALDAAKAEAAKVPPRWRNSPWHAKSEQRDERRSRANGSNTWKAVRPSSRSATLPPRRASSSSSNASAKL
jgi:hypothetical protein